MSIKILLSFASGLFVIALLMLMIPRTTIPAAAQSPAETQYLQKNIAECRSRFYGLSGSEKRFKKTLIKSCVGEKMRAKYGANWKKK